MLVIRYAILFKLITNMSPIRMKTLNPMSWLYVALYNRAFFVKPTRNFGSLHYSSCKIYSRPKSSTLTYFKFTIFDKQSIWFSSTMIKSFSFFTVSCLMIGFVLLANFTVIIFLTVIIFFLWCSQIIMCFFTIGALR